MLRDRGIWSQSVPVFDMFQQLLSEPLRVPISEKIQVFPGHRIFPDLCLNLNLWNFMLVLENQTSVDNCRLR